MVDDLHQSSGQNASSEKGLGNYDSRRCIEVSREEPEKNVEEGNYVNECFQG